MAVPDSVAAAARLTGQTHNNMQRVQLPHVCPFARQHLSLRSIRPLIGTAAQRRQQSQHGTPVQQGSYRRLSHCAAQGRRSEADMAQGGASNLISTVGLLGVWLGAAVFAFVLSPNQTPVRDMYMIEKLIGLGVDDGVPINTVVSSLFYLMGVWPGIYAALLLPSAKSGNQVPAWPFVAGSFAFGIFALGPYFALWEPPRELPKAPPAKADLEGWRKLGVKATESPVIAWILLAAAVTCLGKAALAGGGQWGQALKLFDESRAIHATALDFAGLTLVAPYWMQYDAGVRQWEGRDRLLPILRFIPVLGPAVYLVLRPKAS